MCFFPYRLVFEFIVFNSTKCYFVKRIRMNPGRDRVVFNNWKFDEWKVLIGMCCYELDKMTCRLSYLIWGCRAKFDCTAMHWCTTTIGTPCSSSLPPLLTSYSYRLVLTKLFIGSIKLLQEMRKVIQATQILCSTYFYQFSIANQFIDINGRFNI